MRIHSMTGFARSSGYDAHCSWDWEVRSVNGKGLDVRCRMAGGFEDMEHAARERIKASLGRGNVQATLSITWVRAGGGYRINEDVLNGILEMLPALADRIADAPPPRIENLLALKGVIEPCEDTLPDDLRAELEKALLEGLDEAMAALLGMRSEEGERLGQTLIRQIDAIETLTDEAGRLAALRPEAIRKRLADQVAKLVEDVSALSPERLAQEAALLMTKADVSEELDRLRAHVAAARELMAEDAAIGRKLDFLCQEFNREANTLCSKSSDVELTRVGLEIKAMIEQFREQVQNIE